MSEVIKAAPHPLPRGLLVAVAAVAGATAVMLMLTAWAGPGTPFLMYVAAIVIAAWYGGFWPGFAATVLSLVVSWYAFVPPFRSFGVADGGTVTRLILFLAEGTLISYLCGLLHLARQRAAASADEAGRGERAALERERQYRQAEFRFQRLIEHSPQSTQLFHPDGRTRQVNLAFERLFGITLDQLREYNILRDPELVRLGVMPLMERAFSGEAVTIEPIPYVPDRGQYAGQTRWAGAYVYPVTDDAGRVEEVVLVHSDVTEQRQAEAALRQSEQRLRSLIAQSAAGIAQTDLTGRILFANERFCHLVARPPQELLRLRVHDLTHPDDLAETTRLVAGGAATGHEYAMEKRYVRGDGSVVWVAVSAGVIKDAAGNPESIMGVVVDVSDRKRAEAALRASEARLRFLGELGDRTRGLADPDQVMATVARTLGEHLRVSRCAYAEVEADSDRFTIRHDYTDGCASTVGAYRLDLFGPRAAADQRSGRTLVVHDVDAELAPAEGADMFSAIGIKAVVCCPLVREGRLAAMMAVHQTAPRRWTPDEVALVEIVVERSWAYIERARAVRAVAEREAQFRQLADAMPQMVWVTRPDGYHEYYNWRWYEFTGVPEGSTDGEGWNGMFHPDDRERAWATWRHSLATGEPYEIEYRLRHHSGAYRWTLGRALPIRDAAGAITKWFGTCTDIDAIKRLQQEREHLLDSERNARAEAERTSRVKDEFLATLGHELRTPLNAILGWSQILSTGGQSGDDLREGLATIERNARAQTQIIEDLLDMSRIVSGKVRLDVQRVDLAGVVLAAVETVRPAADAKGIRVQPVLDPLAGPVSGDPSRLQQVFWNLLSNAVKFTPRGGRVQVLLERVDSHLEVSVVDTGEGIAPDFLPHVFDRFRQADSSTTRRHGGLGLGLAIVKQLVELHGGTVRAKSAAPGQGSAFTVSLPLTAVCLDPEPDAERRHPRAGGGGGGGAPELCVALDGVRVLVVDDEPDARSLLRRLLDDCDAVVTLSGSATEAYDRLVADPPDVLVSDIGMPGEDGYALIRRVRALPPDRGGNVPALALTAYARSEDRTRSVLAGFQMHMSKPVEPAELIAVVASLAGRAGRTT